MPVPEVPVLCPRGTVVCLGGGPSLTVDDVTYAIARADAVIAINNTYQLAPEADVLYACDAAWWMWHTDFATKPNELVDPISKRATIVRGRKYALQGCAEFPTVPGLQVLENTGTSGLETRPTGLRTGQNSGYQAINLAVHLGAERVVLLGYDMQTGPHGEFHWHGAHPRQKKASPFDIFLSHFPSLVEPLQQLGIEVWNCSRRTALDCFPKASLAEVLP